jgi:hypothetical protein
MVLALFTNSCYYLFIYLFAPLGFELKASHCYRKTSPLASVLTHNLKTTEQGFEEKEISLLFIRQRGGRGTQPPKALSSHFWEKMSVF